MTDLFGSLQRDLDQRQRMVGLTAADLLDLPDTQRRVVRLLARRGDLALDEVARELALEQDELAAAVADLEERAFVRTATFKGRALLRTHFGRSRRSGAGVDVWAKLSSRTRPDDECRR